MALRYGDTSDSVAAAMARGSYSWVELYTSTCEHLGVVSRLYTVAALVHLVIRHGGDKSINRPSSPTACRVCDLSQTPQQAHTSKERPVAINYNSSNKHIKQKC